MKNSKGITLLSLTITVTIMIILAGAGGGILYSGTNEYKDNAMIIELGMVRQAIVEQYEKAKAVDKLKLNESDFWIGSKIGSLNDIKLPTGKTATEIFGEYNPQYAEDFYYRLDKNSLEKLGIDAKGQVYVVKYSTGEVYNEKKKINSTGDLLYLGPIFSSENDKTQDTTSFNDW